MTIEPLLAAPFTKAVFYLLIVLILFVVVGYLLYMHREESSNAPKDTEGSAAAEDE
ncbi:MAG: hypothetical protein AAF585_10835 [Verrucomicrobiota bacterium]